MGKVYETKAKIITLLREGEKTPTQLHDELELSPATISQHLHELLEMRIVDCRCDEHFKNMRHYSLIEMVVQNK